MKKMRLIMVVLASAILAACQSNNPELKGDIVANPNLPNDSTQIPVAYLSWGGTTQRMAQEIATLTGAELFRIEPEPPTPPSTLRPLRLPEPRKRQTLGRQ